MRKIVINGLEKICDAVFVLFWGIFYYLLFRYYILKILWFGSLPMDYEYFDIHLLFIWMTGCAIGFGWWLKKNALVFFKSALADKIGLLIVSVILLIVFGFGLVLVGIISAWLGDYAQTITFWKRIIIYFQYRH